MEYRRKGLGLFEPLTEENKQLLYAAWKEWSEKSYYEKIAYQVKALEEGMELIEEMVATDWLKDELKDV